MSAVERSVPAAGASPERHGDTLFQLQGVTYRYEGGEAPAVEDVSLTVARGDYVALLGPNGAGKSTLLRLLTGTLAPDAGSALFDGKPVRSIARREVARRIAVLPQRLNLAFETTVEDLVALGRTPHSSLLSALRGPTARDRAAVAAALAQTETDQFGGRTVQTLSGGEQQRVALALALAQEPEVLLLDEPTSHLDPGHALAVLELVETLRRERGLTVVAVFHDLNLAALYAERLLVLHAGRVVAAGPPSAVLRPDLLERVFGPGLRLASHPDGDVPQVLPSRRRPDSSGVAR